MKFGVILVWTTAAVFFVLAVLMTAYYVETLPPKTPAPPASNEVLQYEIDFSVETDPFAAYLQKNFTVGNVRDVAQGSLALSLVPSFVVFSDNPLYDLADIYDNALALNYSSMIGRGDWASRLANSFLGLMVGAGYWPNEASVDVRVGRFRGLYSYYQVETGRHSFGPARLTDVGLLDQAFYVSWKNAMVGIAFCKMLSTFSLTDQDRRYYVQVAFDLWYVMYTYHSCVTGDYQGIETDDDGKKVESLDNIVFASYCSALTPIVRRFGDNEMQQLLSVIDLSRRISRDVVNQFLQRNTVASECNPNPQIAPSNSVYYLTGTKGCGLGLECDSPTPALPQLFAYLTDLASGQELPEQVLNWVSEYASAMDTNAEPSGCGPGARFACSSKKFSQKQMFSGTKYTNRGEGIMMETTGFGVLAMRRLSTHVGGGALKSSLNNGVNTLRRLISEYGDGGIPASFKVKGASAGASSNTGIPGLNYYRYPHTASTMACGMAAQFMGNTNEVFNPFSMVPGKVANTAFIGTRTFSELNIAGRVECGFKNYSTFPEGVGCPTESSAVVIAKYCTLLEQGSSATMKEPDAFLKQRFQVNSVSQYGNLCNLTNPYVAACNEDELAKGLTNSWVEYSKSGAC